MPYSSSSSSGATDGVRAAGAGGGVVPYPALPAHSRVGTQGAAASPRHTAPRLWALLHLRVCAARNFPPRSGQLLLPPFRHARSGPPGLLLPGRRPSLLGRHLSNSERGVRGSFCLVCYFPFLAIIMLMIVAVCVKSRCQEETAGGGNRGQRVQAVSSGGSS